MLAYRRAASDRCGPTSNFPSQREEDNMNTIELLLTSNVDNLGIVGDVVKVRTGYARNYLLPRQLATTPSPEAIKALAARRAEVEKELKALRAMREATLARLEKYELTMQRSANDQGILYGGVSQHDIAEALRAEGFAIEDRAVRIGEQIKRLDTYTVPLVLDQDLRTEIKVWIVSDKPREELDADTAEAQAAEPAAEEKPRKGRKAREEGEAKAEAIADAKPESEKKAKGKKAEPAAAEGEEKPKKK
jgi:large subunit ribosomal protein L9